MTNTPRSHTDELTGTIGEDLPTFPGVPFINHKGDARVLKFTYEGLSCRFRRAWDEEVCSVSPNPRVRAPSIDDKLVCIKNTVNLTTLRGARCTDSSSAGCQSQPVVSS